MTDKRLEDGCVFLICMLGSLLLGSWTYLGNLYWGSL